MFDAISANTEIDAMRNLYIHLCAFLITLIKKTMELENIYIDLSKCSDVEIKGIYEILNKFNEPIYHTDRIILKKGKFERRFPYLALNSGYTQWMSTEINIHNKTELTYPEFIKLFEEPKKLPSELLKEYFKNTQREQVLKDWESTAYLDNTNSPKIREFFEDLEEETFTDKIQKLQADKTELLEALENANYLIKSIKNDCSDSDLYEYYDICMKMERKNQSLIQKHKQ